MPRVKERLTQCEKIRAFLDENGSIDPMQAMHYFGCMRLAARINDLKKEGMYITSNRVPTLDGLSSFARYTSGKWVLNGND